MAEGKNSFTAYCDWGDFFDNMTDAKAGKLAKTIWKYVRDENPQPKDPMVNMAFVSIKSTLKRDLKKWEEKRDKNIANARKRWDKKNAVACDGINRNANDAVSVRVRVRVSDINNIYNKFVDEVKSGNFQSRIESIYMRLRIQKGSLTPLLQDFKNNLIEKNRVHKNTEDLFINFGNWLNTQDRIGKLKEYKK